MKMKKIIYYFYVFGIMSTIPFVVSAKNIGVAVDQTAIVFDVDTGEVQEFVVEVKNISDEEQKIDVDAMNYVLGDNNAITLSDDNAEGNIKDWISSRDESIVLTPGGAHEVIFSVEAPDNASVGSHRGAVLFRVTPNNDDTVKVQGQIGMHVLVNVKGDTHASGQINSFDIPLLTSGSVDYATEFENTGNIHYVPYGEVKVHNIFTKNEQIYEYDKHFVFPGKKFTFLHTEQVPSLFGLYKVQVTFVDGEGATRVKSDYSMGYFFPLTTIIILVIIMIILYKIKKSKNHKKTDEDSVQFSNDPSAVKINAVKENVEKKRDIDNDQKDEKDERDEKDVQKDDISDADVEVKIEKDEIIETSLTEKEIIKDDVVQKNMDDGNSKKGTQKGG